MPAASHLSGSLRFSRGFSLRLLEELDAEEDWVFKATYQSNHALWFAGHMGATDNGAIGWIDPGRALVRDDYSEKFAMGSKPVSELSAYPPIDEVRAWMDERRKVLLELVDPLSEADLASPPRGPAPPFIANIESAIQFVIWHEGMHVGQITVAHRAMGYAPFIGRPDGEPTGF